MTATSNKEATVEPQRSETSTGSDDPRVDAHKGWLVETGDRIGRLAKDQSDWKSQIRGILEAARTETHPAVLENLVQYQAARNKNWRNPDVASPLLKAMHECQKKAGDDLDLTMDLIRHLLLYTLRAHTSAVAFPQEVQASKRVER